MTNLFTIKVANSNIDIQVSFDMFEQVEQISILQLSDTLIPDTIKTYPIKDMSRLMEQGIKQVS